MYVKASTEKTFEASCLSFFEKKFSFNASDSKWDKIYKIVQIVFKTAVSILLFWTNHYVFACGFTLGIIEDEWVMSVIQKIKDIWTTQPWSVLALIGVASAISLPAPLAISSFIWASYLGAMLSRSAKNILKTAPQDSLIRQDPPGGEISQKPTSSPAA